MLLAFANRTTGPLIPTDGDCSMSRYDWFRVASLDTSAVQKLVSRYVQRLKLDPNVSVHSFRVTALTTAREQGSDIIGPARFRWPCRSAHDADLYSESRPAEQIAGLCSQILSRQCQSTLV